MDAFSPGLRKMPKLTNDHINLGPRTRMRVNLAVQVFYIWSIDDKSKKLNC